jgi:hypothetical protein
MHLADIRDDAQTRLHRRADRDPTLMNAPLRRRFPVAASA